MKKLSFIIFSLGILFSCSDLLEEKPQAIAVETYYNTAEEIASGVYAIYSPLRSVDLLATEQEASSDQFYRTIGSYSAASKFQGLDNTNINRVGSIWNNMYKAIRNANIIIQAIPKAGSASEDDKNRLLGEAKFLRAYAYFTLVRNWGAVPLRTEDNISQTDMARSPESEVYDLIKSDLDFAVASLPITAPVSGRPSKWSASMLLADVYFYLNDYSKAAELTKQIIDSEQFSLIDVKSSDDISDIFGPTQSSSSEELFYFKYNDLSTNWFPVCLHGGTIAGKYIPQSGYNLLHSREDYSVYVNQDDKDLRKGLWYSYTGGLVGEKGLLLKKYIDVDGATGPRNLFPVYRYADCLIMYAEASCRVASKPTEEGVEALNMVHRRAYGYSSATASPVDFNINDYDEDSFVDLCIKEEGYETVGEAKRWYFLKRLGKAAAQKIIRETRGIDIAEKAWLWPIPVEEMNYNSAITVEDQNPGY